MSRVSDVIKHDHRELEDYYNRIVSSTDHDEQTRFQNQFVWELARHSIGEELVVYPVFERAFSGGAEIAARDRKEHQKLKEELYKFQSLSAADETFLPTLKSLYSDLKEHIEEEEKEDLVRLENAIDESESESLARSFRRTKNFVPTHSHPSAPDKPPFETIIGLMTAPIDKLQDMFKKFPKE